MLDLQRFSFSALGFIENYFIDESGAIFYNQQKLKEYKDGRVTLKTKSGERKKIAVKKIYRAVFNKEYCHDLIEDLQGEEWREISNTKGKYFVSNYGRVKSYCRLFAVILQPQISDKGYQRVSINGTKKRLHRLVAIAFLDNKDPDKTQVHHKDFNRLNNNKNNLQWVSFEEHLRLHSKKPKGEENVLHTL